MTLRRRLLLTGLLAAALLGTAAAVLGATLVASMGVEAAGRRLLAEAELLGELLSPLPTLEDRARLVAESGLRLGVRVSLFDHRGRLVADSAVALAESGPEESARPELVEARAVGRGLDLRPSRSLGQDVLHAARRVGEGEGALFVRLAQPTRDLARLSAGSAALSGVMMIAALAVVALVIDLIVRRALRPVAAMALAAEEVAQGRLDRDPPALHDPDLGPLSLAIARMRRALLQRLSEIRAEHALFETMTDGMEEGLMLLGPDLRVLLANGAARRILRVHYQPAGRLAGEVIRQPEILGAIDRCRETGEDQLVSVSDVPHRDRSFEVRLRAVDIPGAEGPRGLLVLIRDVTQVDALERVRRQFVADLSHELRTPVTSILAAAETLQDPDLVQAPAAQRFAGTIARQARRMADLLEDLADLSRIETGAVQLDLEPIELAGLVREVLDWNEERATGQGVRLVHAVRDGLVVRADRRRLEQILQNLVDNAVKFNRRGGSVTVSAASEGAFVRIEVADTGVGIPAASLGQVFQRFYQVDPARGREGRGAGLGLAIVKHLVRLHGGEIEVNSTLGEGTTFSLRMPGDSTGEAPGPVS